MVWRADDENDDTLSYELRYRREGETSWHVLRSGIEDPIFAWDTTILPDGTYFVKVVASDAPSNAPAEALTGEMDSAPFEIDNTPPAITVAEVRRDGARTRVAFAVADNHAPIDRVEYSLDGVRWHAVFPTDGIADSRSERYAVTIEETVGPRGITLRAADAMHNLAAAHVEPPPATGR
jgi:flavin-binding protein dodecin